MRIKLKHMGLELNPAVPTVLLPTLSSLQVRIKLKHMELEIRRRETAGSGAAAKSESGGWVGGRLGQRALVVAAALCCYSLRCGCLAARRAGWHVLMGGRLLLLLIPRRPDAAEPCGYDMSCHSLQRRLPSMKSWMGRLCGGRAYPSGEDGDSLLTASAVCSSGGQRSNGCCPACCRPASAASASLLRPGSPSGLGDPRPPNPSPASNRPPPARRLSLRPYELSPSYASVFNKFSVRYFLNLVLVDEEDRRYFKQQVGGCRQHHVRLLSCMGLPRQAAGAAARYLLR